MTPEVGTRAGVSEVVARATVRLREAGSPTPALDAQVLVAHAVGRDRAWLLAHPEAALDGHAAELVRDWVERRATGEPVAYIRGFKEWYGLHLATDQRALIPRPETELLVDEAIAVIEQRLVRDLEPIRAWEVATGSGAVSVALARRFRTALQLGRLGLTASDLSPDALELAAKNAASLGVGGWLRLASSDLLDAAPRGGVLDLVIANLPYLRSADAASGAGSLAFEPRLALDGGVDGLAVLRRLVAELPAYLAPDGVALLEVGAGQARSVRRLVEAWPEPGRVSSRRDLAGIERVVRIERVGPVNR
ncbi:MAG TPA: peptide chain release factor N(5)-glutamine methyltransferase [Candidatus Limnocylindria bacterium]|nr:peptide chain release factor N(5)-glutamine methyltransferase [Candidatus Limnocylindria bacterium]